MENNTTSVSYTETKTDLIAEGFRRKVMLASGTLYCSRVKCVRQHGRHNHNISRDSSDASLCANQYRVIMCSSEVDCMKYEFTRVHYFSATFLLAVFPPKEPLPQRTSCYLIVDAFETGQEAENLIAYLKTKFVYHLIPRPCKDEWFQNLLNYVPILDFKETWTDEKLYAAYNFTKEEIKQIEAIASK